MVLIYEFLFIQTEVSEVNKDSDDVILNEQNENAGENDVDISSIVTSGKVSGQASLEKHTDQYGNSKYT